MNLFVLNVMSTMLAKPKELYMKDVMNMAGMTKIYVFNHLNECIGVQHMFEIGKLTPSLFTNNIIDDEFDLKSSRVNLVRMNT